MIERTKAGWRKSALACTGMLLLLAANGCVSLESASAGQIGCLPDDVTISDDSLGFGTRTWTAHCHGHDFSCSSVSTGKDSSQVDCTPIDKPISERAAGEVVEADRVVRHGAAPRQKPPAAPAEAVRAFVRAGADGVNQCVFQAVFEGRALELISAPAKGQTGATLAFRQPDRGVECDLQLAVDGVAVALAQPTATSTNGVRELRTSLDAESFQQLMAATRITFSSCGARATLPDAARAKLAELQIMVREEAAFSTPPQGAAPSAAP